MIKICKILPEIKLNCHGWRSHESTHLLYFHINLIHQKFNYEDQRSDQLVKADNKYLSYKNIFIAHV